VARYGTITGDATVDLPRLVLANSEAMRRDFEPSARPEGN